MEEAETWEDGEELQEAEAVEATEEAAEEAEAAEAEADEAVEAEAMETVAEEEAEAEAEAEVEEAEVEGLEAEAGDELPEELPLEEELLLEEEAPEVPEEFAWHDGLVVCCWYFGKMLINLLLLNFSKSMQKCGVPWSADKAHYISL